MDLPSVNWPDSYTAVMRFCYHDDFKKFMGLFPTKYDKNGLTCVPIPINNDKAFQNLFAPNIVRLLIGYIECRKYLFKKGFIKRILQVPKLLKKFDCVIMPQDLIYQVKSSCLRHDVNIVIKKQGDPLKGILAIRDVYNPNDIIEFVHISGEDDFIKNLNQAIRTIGPIPNIATLLVTYNKFEVDWESALDYILSAKDEFIERPKLPELESLRNLGTTKIVAQTNQSEIA
jgi:hypothetical protein